MSNIRYYYNQILKIIKFIISLIDTELNFYAASLSFYTIFALVPLLLVVLSVITTLPNFDNLYNGIKDLILSNLIPTNEQVVSRYLDTFLHNSTQLGELGFITILITSILFFKNFQYVAAKTFHSQPRDFWNSLTTYWTLVTLFPIGIGISIFLSSYLQKVLMNNGLEIDLSWIVVVPVPCLLFFLIFKISANKPITTMATLISAILAALVWELSKAFFVSYTLYNKAYLTIYGSFSIVLLFLLWIYISWLIVLYGMKFCEVFNEYFDKICCKMS